MSLTYTRALEVNAGDCILPVHWNSQAAAVNDRLLGGVGDPTWRLWWKVASVARQICAPADEFSYPAEDDYLNYYLHVDPRVDDFTFECAADLNFYNPLAAFAMGSEELGVFDEVGRLEDVGPASALDTLSQLWDAAALQRGAVVVTPSMNAATALIAASSHVGISYLGSLLPYLKGYGGYLGTAQRGSSIAYAPTGSGFSEWLTWELWRASAQNTGADYFEPILLVFSPVAGGAPTYYHPAAPPYDGSYVFDLADVTYRTNVKTLRITSDSYILTRINGDVVTLSRAEYIEGPYGAGGNLLWTQGHQLEQTLQLYADEFKGNETQRALCSQLSTVGARWDLFFTRQYALAPAYGEDAGGGLISAIYPEFTFTDAAVDGDFAACSEGGSSYQVHADFVFAGYYAEATGLGAAVTIQLFNDSTLLASFELTPAAPAVLAYFDAPVEALIKVKLVGTPALSPGGTIVVKTAELQSYKPTIEDAYLVLRLGTTRGDETADVDTIGIDYSEANAKVRDFLRFGCIISDESLPVQDTAGLWQNPIIETFRRMVRENLHYVGRKFGDDLLLLDYSVNGSDQSVLKFKRYGTYEGQTIDLWRGVAPEGEATDGIVSTAPSQGQTQRWCMFLSTMRYSRSEASVMKRANFADVVPLLHDRCGQFDPVLDPASESYDLAYHFSYYGGGGVKCEMPSGYRYAKSYFNAYSVTPLQMNASPSDDFRKSCQVYVPDYEVASITLEDAGETVAVTLSGRLRHTEAVASFASYGTDGSGNLTEDGAAPAYRTDENAVMEHLIDADGAGPESNSYDGDQAVGADPSDYSDCGGSTDCRFYFTRLIPEVNTTGGGFATRMIAKHGEWLHFLLETICEGFVDKQQSAVDSCPERPLVDYSFPRLAHQALNGDPFELVPSSLSGTTLSWTDEPDALYAIQSKDAPDGIIWTTITTVDSSPYTVSDAVNYTWRVVILRPQGFAFPLFSAEDRPDATPGYGPLSNTCAQAELFNLYSRALNLLDTARIDLPLDAEWRQATTHQDFAWNPSTNVTTDACGAAACDGGQACNLPGGGNLNAAWWLAGNVTPTRAPMPGESDWSAWEPYVAGGYTSLINVDPAVTDGEVTCVYCDDDGPMARVSETRFQVRINSGSDNLLAISEHIRDMVEASPTIYIHKRAHQYTHVTPGITTLDCDEALAPCGLEYTYTQTDAYGETCGVLSADPETGETIIECEDLPAGPMLGWFPGVGETNWCGVAPHGQVTWELTTGNMAVTIPLL